MEIERFILEIEELNLRYRSLDFDDSGNWVYIPQFDLPPGWNRRTSELLIEIPAAYPATPPDGFFIDRKLRTKDGGKPGHYFEDCKYTKQGWAWLCLHIENWKPHTNVVDGDNLLKVTECIYTELTELSRRRKDQ